MDSLELTQRILMARKHGRISQAILAQQIGVHRSAVSHWESSKPKRPNTEHLVSIAVATGVQFEWLATGRGTMLPAAVAAVGDPGAGIVVDDGRELELLQAFRDMSVQARPVLLELAHQLARRRNGRAAQARPTMLMHALELRLGDEPAP